MSQKLLSKREDFFEWKQHTMMIALSKCDGFERIFFNAGTTPAELQEHTALSPANRRKWDVARVHRAIVPSCHRDRDR